MHIARTTPPRIVARQFLGCGLPGHDKKITTAELLLWLPAEAAGPKGCLCVVWQLGNHSNASVYTQCDAVMMPSCTVCIYGLYNSYTQSCKGLCAQGSHVRAGNLFLPKLFPMWRSASAWAKGVSRDQGVFHLVYWCLLGCILQQKAYASAAELSDVVRVCSVAFFSYSFV